jgi:hypothetical protein
MKSRRWKRVLTGTSVLLDLLGFGRLDAQHVIDPHLGVEVRRLSTHERRGPAPLSL